MRKTVGEHRADLTHRVGYSGQIQLLRNLEPPTEPAFLFQVFLVLFACFSTYFLVGWWECAVWSVAYVGLQICEKTYVRAVSDDPSFGAYVVLLAILFLEASVYCFMAVYLWFLGPDLAKFGSLALITASTMHSMLHRATYPSILMCFLIPDAAVFLIICVSAFFMFGASPEAFLYLIAGFAIASFFLIMFFQTYRKEADAMATQEALQQAQRLDVMGKLTGGIAHDFNNLLSVVSGNLQLVGETQDRREVDRLTNDALQASERCADLTAKLLSFGQKAPLRPSIVAPQAALAELELFLNRLLPSNVVIEYECAPNLLNVVVDDSALQSALINLVLNSADAIRDGGKITVRARPGSRAQAGEFVCFSVSDNGPGIPKELEHRIFEPFFSTKLNDGGSGLGLPMVKGFVEQSFGHIELISDSDGTSVRLCLPASSAEAHMPKRAKMSSDGTGRPAVDCKLMIVDDNVQLLRAIQIMLEREGYSVMPFENGDAAQEYLTNNAPPDLLITDAVMPGAIQGADLISLVKGRSPEVPTILISGYAEENRSSNLPTDRSDMFMIKPLDLKELSMAVHASLNTKSVR